MSRAKYRCNFQRKHLPQSVTKPLKLDLRSKSAPIMKETERILFFSFLWRAFRPTQSCGWEESCSGVGCQRLRTTSSRHRTTPSTLGSHSTLFFFFFRSVESKLRLGRRRRRKINSWKMWKLLDASIQRHECGFLTDGRPPSKINNAKHCGFLYFFTFKKWNLTVVRHSCWA